MHVQQGSCGASERRAPTGGEVVGRRHIHDLGLEPRDRAHDHDPRSPRCQHPPTPTRISTIRGTFEIGWNRSSPFQPASRPGLGSWPGLRRSSSRREHRCYGPHQPGLSNRKCFHISPFAKGNDFYINIYSPVQLIMNSLILNEWIIKFNVLIINGTKIVLARNNLKTIFLFSRLRKLQGGRELLWFRMKFMLTLFSEAKSIRQWERLVLLFRCLPLDRCRRDGSFLAGVLVGSLLPIPTDSWKDQGYVRSLFYIPMFGFLIYRSIVGAGIRSSLRTIICLYLIRLLIAFRNILAWHLVQQLSSRSKNYYI